MSIPTRRLEPGATAWQGRQRLGCINRWELFDSEDGDDITAARRICNACPVRTQCLRDVIALEGSEKPGQRAGVRAGYTPEERHWVYLKYVAKKPVPEVPYSQGCGSGAGYDRHTERGEPACEACKAAHAREVSRAVVKQREADEAARRAWEQRTVVRRPPGPERDRIAAEREQQVRALWSKGLIDREIAVHVDLTVSGVGFARRRLGLTANGVRQLKPIAHGTERGYKQHRYRKEVACEPCFAASREAAAARRVACGVVPRTALAAARERQVREMVRMHFTDRQMAERTGMSMSGVRNVRRRLGLYKPRVKTEQAAAA